MVINSTEAENDIWNWAVLRYQKGFDVEFSEGDVELAQRFLTCDWFCDETLTFLCRLLSKTATKPTRQSLETYAAFILVLSIDAMFNLWDRNQWVCPNSFLVRYVQRVLETTRNVNLVLAYNLATEFEDLDVIDRDLRSDLRDVEYIKEAISLLESFYTSTSLDALSFSKYPIENVNFRVLSRYFYNCSRDILPE